MPQIQVSQSVGKLNDRMIRHLRLLGSLAMLQLLPLAEQLKNKVQQEKHINLSWIGMLSWTAKDSKDSAVDHSGGDLAQWFLNLFQTNYGCMNPSHKLFSYQGYICYKNPGVIQESQNQIYKSKALEPSQTSADKEAVGKKSYPPCWTKNSPLANHFLCKMLESDVHDHQQSSHGFVCRDSNINRPRSKLSAESSVMQLTAAVQLP